MLRWSIDWQNDGTVDEVFGSGAAAASHVFDKPGPVMIRVEVVDEDVLPGESFSAEKSIGVTVSVREGDISAGGPYTIAEGEGVMLSASAVGMPIEFTWDLNNDGAFGDVVGRDAWVEWEDLQQLAPNPIEDDGTFPIKVQVFYDYELEGMPAATAETHLTVLNSEPTATPDNSGPVDEGKPAMVSFGVGNMIRRPLTGPQDLATATTSITTAASSTPVLVWPRSR